MKIVGRLFVGIGYWALIAFVSSIIFSAWDAIWKRVTATVPPDIKGFYWFGLIIGIIGLTLVTGGFFALLGDIVWSYDPQGTKEE